MGGGFGGSVCVGVRGRGVSAKNAPINPRAPKQEAELAWKLSEQTTNFGHGGTTHSLHLHAISILGPFPGLVPGQQALRSDIRNAAPLRGAAHLSQHALAGIHSALRSSRYGVLDAHESDAHVTPGGHDAAPSDASPGDALHLRPGPYPTAEHWNVGDKADAGLVEGQPGREPLFAGGAVRQDQRWSGGDYW